MVFLDPVDACFEPFISKVQTSVTNQKSFYRLHQLLTRHYRAELGARGPPQILKKYNIHDLSGASCRLPSKIHSELSELGIRGKFPAIVHKVETDNVFTAHAASGSKVLKLCPCGGGSPTQGFFARSFYSILEL